MEANEQTKQTNSQTQATVSLLPEGKGGDGDEEGRGGQIYGDRKRLDFGWSAHSGIYRCCIIKL